MKKRIDTSALRMAVLRAISDGKSDALYIESSASVRGELALLPTELNGGRCFQLYVSNALQALRKAGLIAHHTGGSSGGWRVRNKGIGALKRGSL